jgi:hypothetical protein
MIRMDGRAHPSDLAPHTWGGFSTGRWDKNTLVVTTTHIKAGWLQRNGAPTSDLAAMPEHFIRHGDQLMVVTFIDDPVLAEPFIRTTNFVHTETGSANAWGSCGPAQIGDELPGRSKEYVPHYLPGQVDHIEDFLKTTGVPAEGARGGPETIYPEFALRLAALAQGGPAGANHVPPWTPPTGPMRSAERPKPTGDVRVVPVQGNLYLLAAAGNNVAMQVGR